MQYVNIPTNLLVAAGVLSSVEELQSSCYARPLPGECATQCYTFHRIGAEW